MSKSFSFLLSAIAFGALVFSSCADRHETLQTEMDLIGSWSGVYNEVGALSVGENHLFVADNERAGFTVFALEDEAAPSPMGGSTGLHELYAPGDADYLSSFLLDDW